MKTRFGVRGPAFVVWVALIAMGGKPAFAQGRPFIFTVTTAAPAEPGERWTLRYDAGYAKRTTDPLGFDGMEQDVSFQGALGHGITLLGQMGVGLDGQATSTSQQIEVLKDVRPASRGLALALGVGIRREWEGSTILVGRVSTGHRFETSSLFGNVRFEKPFEQGRDRVDVITSVGWLRRFGRGLHVGAEAVGEDLEGLWEPDEAEGGAKLFVGPSVHIALPDRSWSLSMCAGPILYATRTGRTSQAVRPLEARGNGFTARLSVGYSF